MKCKFCGTQLVKGIEVCQNCGYVNSRKAGKKIGLIAAAAALVVAIVIAMFFLFSGKDDLYLMMDEEEYLGYVNKSGEWVIEPQFIRAGDFHEGLAYAADPETELFGYIDKSGEWVIEPQFYLAEDFSEGYAAVSKESWNYYITYDEFNYSKEDASQEPLYGYIDKSGKVVAEPRYASARDFVDGYAWVKEVEGVTLGEVVYVYTSYDDYIYWDSGDGMDYMPTSWTEDCDRWEMKHINMSFEEEDPGYPDDVYELHDERCQYYDNETGLYGYYDKDGNVVIDPQYQEAEEFSEGLALVADRDTSLYGFIDKDGNYVIEPKYEIAMSFANGLAFAYEDRDDAVVCRCIDKKGNTVIEKVYKY